jgi:hypothetical protein
MRCAHCEYMLRVKQRNGLRCEQRAYRVVKCRCGPAAFGRAVFATILIVLMEYSEQTQHIIDDAFTLSERLQLLINSDRRSFVIRSGRDPMALMYWNIAFEHHQGLLLLLKHYYPAPAFALLRVLHEAAFRSFLAMFGTEKQLAAMKEGTYQMDFAAVAKMIDEKMESDPMLEPLMRYIIKGLHGFTHGGPQQLLRQFKRMPDSIDITSAYSEMEVCGLVGQTVIIIGLVAAFTTEFFNLSAENTKALEILVEHIQKFPKLDPAAATA